MRIAIITLPLHNNYGGILQAYALQTILEKMGHKIEVIDKRRKRKSHIPFNVKIKRYLLKYIFLKKIKPLEEDIAYKRQKEENKHTWRFIDKYIHRREIDSFYDIKEEDYDTIIVGSDQVWRPRYFTGNYNCKMTAAFLDFTKGWQIRRISYAASFGSEFWEFSKEDTIDCTKYIKMFDAISVREQLGVSFLAKYLKYNNSIVLPDPTLLLDKKDYINLFKCSPKYQLPETLFVYYIDETEDKIKLSKIVAKQKGLKIININHLEKKQNKNSRIKLSVENWLKCFYYAKYIVTDSFHGCLFSIIFNKEFIVYGNEERGMARFNHLLLQYNLKDRLIMNSSMYKEMIIKSNLPSENQIIINRESGIRYLQTYLQNV